MKKMETSLCNLYAFSFSPVLVGGAPTGSVMCVLGEDEEYFLSA